MVVGPTASLPFGRVSGTKAPNDPPPLSELLAWTSPRTTSSDRFDDFLNSPRPARGCHGPVRTNSLNGPVIEIE